MATLCYEALGAAPVLMFSTILQVCYFFEQSPFQQLGQDAVCNACVQTCVSPSGAQAALAPVRPSPYQDSNLKVQSLRHWVFGRDLPKFPLLELPQELVEKVAATLGPEDQKAKKAARSTCTRLRSAINTNVSSVRVRFLPAYKQTQLLPKTWTRTSPSLHSQLIAMFISDPVIMVIGNPALGVSILRQPTEFCS